MAEEKEQYEEVLKLSGGLLKKLEEERKTDGDSGGEAVSELDNIWMMPFFPFEHRPRCPRERHRCAPQGIHEFLRRQKHVKSYRLGEFGEGDAGVTIVELK